MISALILIFVLAYAVRGWRRGLVVEVIELAALVTGIIVAYFAWPLIAGWFDGWAAALGGAAVFAVVFVAGLFAARWAGGHTRSLPSIGAAVDGAGGTIVATTWSLLLATAILVLAATAPGARAQLATPVCESPVAKALISDANPLHGPGEQIAVLGRPVLLWLNQRIAETVTLSHADSICQELPAGGSGEPVQVPDPTHYTFPASSEDEIEVAAEAERAVFELLNQARAEAGLRTLEWDEPLRDVGRAHSRDMYLRGYFAHETPECREHGTEHPGCTDPFDRIRNAGITYDVAGENLALAPSPPQAHDGLMRSPGHRANILNPHYTRVGIGVYRGPFGLMVTQVFGG